MNPLLANCLIRLLKKSSMKELKLDFDGTIYETFAIFFSVQSGL